MAKSRGNRTPRTELLGRHSFVTACLSNGAHHAAAVRLCQERFGVSRSTAKRYIQKGLEDLREAASLSREVEIVQAKLRLEEIYRLASEKNDLRAALRALVELCKLLGLYDRRREDAKPQPATRKFLQELCPCETPDETEPTLIEPSFGVTKPHKSLLETVTTSAAA